MRRSADVEARPGLLDGTIVFESPPVRDDRGFVARTFDADIAIAAGCRPGVLVQESQVRSFRGVVRGLHLRTDGGEVKLVRCSSGAVVYAAVDLRPASPTYRLWMTAVLDDVEHRSLWLPPGLAHGFQALTKAADVCCRVDRESRPGYATIRYDDPELAIPWPLPVRGLSRGDREAPALADVESRLGEWFGAMR
jgi:dTDP-4-dehydrorhamnose 3,5-epimerase